MLSRPLAHLNTSKKMGFLRNSCYDTTNGNEFWLTYYVRIPRYKCGIKIIPLFKLTVPQGVWSYVV